MKKNGPVIIVTGGAQGIGKGISVHFLRLGWRVAMADIDSQAGEECQLEYENKADNLLYVCTDVGDEEMVMQCVADTIDRFGRVDALVNNAGIADPDQGPMEKLALSEWNRIIRTNLTGCFLMSKHCIPYLRRSRGSIINIASTRALQSEPNTAAYSASKGGIVALTHSMAISLGPEIRVNCISPGWIEGAQWQKSSMRRDPALTERDHEQHPAGRVGNPEDIAAITAYLVSEAAGFVTGQNFVVDGGMTRKMIYEP